MAQLAFNRTGTAKDEATLLEARYKAQYSIAKEKCDDLSGNDKKVCAQQAQSNRDKAKANLKQARKVEDAVEDAAAVTMKADYAVARVKCDALAADAKDVCVASSKACESPMKRAGIAPALFLAAPQGRSPAMPCAQPQLPWRCAVVLSAGPVSGVATRWAGANQASVARRCHSAICRSAMSLAMP